MLDKDNKVIRNSIIWCDQRTGKEVVEITEKVGHDRLIAITANPAITGFTAAKIMWVKNNEPENYEKCRDSPQGLYKIYAHGRVCYRGFRRIWYAAA